jgi:hypothetical protein
MFKNGNIFIRRFEARKRQEEERMAKRIWIYGLTLVVRKMTSYIKKWETQIRGNAGDGVWAVVQLLMGIAEILLAIIAGNENVEGDWNGAEATLSSAQINQVNAVIAQWNAASDAMGA